MASSPAGEPPGACQRRRTDLVALDLPAAVEHRAQKEPVAAADVEDVPSSGAAQMSDPDRLNGGVPHPDAVQCRDKLSQAAAVIAFVVRVSEPLVIGGCVEDEQSA